MNKSNNSKKKEKVTIIDVAKKAGVAVTTVSRVINDRDDVKPETRSKVLEVMMQLNYVPSKAARILGGKTEDELGNEHNSIGLILSESIKTNPYYIHILNGIESELSSKGFACVYSQLNSIINNTLTPENFQASSLIFKTDISGIINIGTDLEKIINRLRRINKPMVFVDSSDLGDDLTYVQANNVEGAIKAVSHLVSLNHRRISIIMGNKGSSFFSDLKKGYLEVLQENKIPVDRTLITKGQDSTEFAYEQASRLLSLENPPTAFFSNDIISIGVMKAIIDKGLKIPEDISIIGFDDIDAVKYLDPPLTTIQVPKKEIGTIAAKKIIELIKHEGDPIPTKTFLPSKLVVRNSTGPVSAGKR